LFEPVVVSCNSDGLSLKHQTPNSFYKPETTTLKSIALFSFLSHLSSELVILLRSKQQLSTTTLNFCYIWHLTFARQSFTSFLKSSQQRSTLKWWYIAAVTVIAYQLEHAGKMRTIRQGKRNDRVLESRTNRLPSDSMFVVTYWTLEREWRQNTASGQSKVTCGGKTIFSNVRFTLDL